MRKLVDSGQIPGILAYSEGKPIGWSSIAPRESFPALERSRILKRVDDERVWSVVCFFVAKPFRHRGLMAKLLKASAEFAAKQGGKIVEGYPIDAEKPQPAPFVYTGLYSAFRKAGFAEVCRRSKTRPIMRFFAKSSQKTAYKRLRKGF
jgi:GNAT superfamily N-acetyltransferase